MSKNFVREINNIDDINKQGFLTNKVNDLLSTKKHNYIRKETQQYHCLTDNLKTLSSSNTSLLSVTCYNETSNKAVLHPKHDATKEQVLKSTNNTINIAHGANDSEEKTNVDTNPKKVLEHDNLLVGDNLTKTHTDGTNTTTLKVSDAFTNRVETLESDVSYLKGDYVKNVTTTTNYITSSKVGNVINLNELNMVNLINTKQNKLTAGSGITIDNNTISSNVKRTSGEMTFGNQTIQTSAIYVNNFITSLTLSARRNEHIDLSSLNISPLNANLVDNWNGQAFTRHPIANVVYEATDSSGNMVKYNGVALYKITADKTLQINTTSITSGLLVNNLDKVLSVTFS